MDPMPWQAVVFQSFPEGVVVICLGLALVGLRFPWIRIIIAAALYAISSYFIRGLPFPYGIHTLLLIVVLILLMLVIVRGGWKSGTMAAMAGTFGLLIVESLVIPLLLGVTGISFAQVIADRWLRVFFAWPEQGVLWLITYLCWRFEWYFLKVEELDLTSQEDDGS